MAYNPDDVSKVWLIDNGVYIVFELIESRFIGCNLAQVSDMQVNQRAIIKNAYTANLQAKIDLAEHIEAVAHSTFSEGDTSIKQIRKTRQREQTKTHIDFMRGTEND